MTRDAIDLAVRARYEFSRYIARVTKEVKHLEEPVEVVDDRSGISRYEPMHVALPRLINLAPIIFWRAEIQQKALFFLDWGHDARDCGLEPGDLDDLYEPGERRVVSEVAVKGGAAPEIEEEDPTALVVGFAATHQVHLFYDGFYGQEALWAIAGKPQPKGIGIFGLVYIWIAIRQTQGHYALMTFWLVEDHAPTFEEIRPERVRVVAEHDYKITATPEWIANDPSIDAKYVRAWLSLNAWLQSPYCYQEVRKPSGKGNVLRPVANHKEADVRVAIMRRPEAAAARKTREEIAKAAAEEARRKARLEEAGKRWELDHEAPTQGHWRNQWYASEGLHRKVWIRDFVRGKGKGEREQRPTVYKAVR